MPTEPAKDLHVIIPAGGAGTRLWPLSRKGRPKFLLDLTGAGRTLLQQTVDRLEPVAASVTIVTGAAHRDGVLEQLPEFDGTDPARRLLIEPEGRDSMPAIGLATYVTRQIHGDDAVVGSFAADHVIKDETAFREAVIEAMAAARAGYVTTIGIGPSEASTAYGYIAPGPAVDMGGGQGADAAPGVDAGAEVDAAVDTDPGASAAKVVERFVEKPDAETAARYVADGYLWNAGMFVMSTGTLAGHLRRLDPEMDRYLAAISGAWGSEGFESGLAEAWPRLRKIAIDHEIAEPVSLDGGVAVVPASSSMGWTDVGDFGALAALTTPSQHRQNGQTALAIRADGVHTFGDSSQLIAVVGVDDVAVVTTSDAVLVTALSAAQSVKDAVDTLRDQGRSDLL